MPCRGVTNPFNTITISFFLMLTFWLARSAFVVIFVCHISQTNCFFLLFVVPICTCWDCLFSPIHYRASEVGLFYNCSLAMFSLHCSAIPEKWGLNAKGNAVSRSSCRRIDKHLFIKSIHSFISWHTWGLLLWQSVHHSVVVVFSFQEFFYSVYMGQWWSVQG